MSWNSLFLQVMLALNSESSICLVSHMLGLRKYLLSGLLLFTEQPNSHDCNLKLKYFPEAQVLALKLVDILKAVETSEDETRLEEVGLEGRPLNVILNPDLIFDVLRKLLNVLPLP